MKGLITLIKLNKRTLDELRRKMAALENDKAKLQDLTRKLKDELARELTLAGARPEMGSFFGDFSRRIRAKQGEIAEQILGIDRQMDELNIEITDAFSEIKKYEIALANFKQREADKAARRQGLEMDEIAQQQYRRKQNDDG